MTVDIPRVVTTIISLLGVYLLYWFANWRGLVIALVIIVLFELWHRFIYGFSITDEPDPDELARRYRERQR